MHISLFGGGYTGLVGNSDVMTGIFVATRRQVEGLPFPSRPLTANRMLGGKFRFIPKQQAQTSSTQGDAES